MTASEAQIGRRGSHNAPAPPRHESVSRDCGRVPGRGTRDFERPAGRRRPPDLRGARGFGFDEASWIPTALNMAMMFSGVFVVFVNALFGPRRILLPAAAIFTLVSAMLPFVPGYWPMLLLVVIAGLSSGTFYSLTMTFVLTALPKRLIIFGIAAYAADIVFVSNIATLLEGWYIEHLSWAWIFWTAAAVTPLMMLCIYFGIPRRLPSGPVPSWRGFAYFSASLALIYGALDQGERLDWLNSGVIVAMLAGGVFLFIATCIRRIEQPNPTLSLSFSEQQEHDHPGVIDFCVQVRAPFRARSRSGVPEHDSSVSAARNRTRAGLGRRPDVRHGLVGRVARDLYKLQTDACIRTDSRCGRLLGSAHTSIQHGPRTILKPWNCCWRWVSPAVMWGWSAASCFRRLNRAL